MNTYADSCTSASTMARWSTTRCTSCDSHSVAAAKKTFTLIKWVLFAWHANGDLDQVTAYWLLITIDECFVCSVYFFTIVCVMIWFVILVSNISFFHLFFSPSPSRNWYPGAQSKLLRFPMTVRASRCMARIVQHVLPSSTNVGMCLTTVLRALNRYSLMKNSYSIHRIESTT